jgi:hypothetical protein
MVPDRTDTLSTDKAMTHFLLAASLGCLLGLSACAERQQALLSQQDGLSISDEFSLYERAQILRAANEWKIAAGRTFEGWRVVAGSPGSGERCGFTNTLSKTITLSPDRPEGAVTAALFAAPPVSPTALSNMIAAPIRVQGDCDAHATMLHEFGHAAGLDHKPGTVMDPLCCAFYRSIDPYSAKRARALMVGNTVR